MPNWGVVLFIGGSGTGKTTAMEDLLYRKRDAFDQFMVMSGSKDTARRFAQHIPPIFVSDGPDAFDEDKLTAIVDKQDADKEMEDSGRGKCNSILIIIDDLAYMSSLLKKSRVLNRLFFNAPHCKIMLWLSMQYVNCIGPNLRQNVRYAFITREKNRKNRERVFDSMNTGFESFADFDLTMRACTQNYRMFVLDNHTQSDKVEDCCFWFKAHKTMPAFKVQRESVMWTINDQVYDNEYQQRALRSAIERRKAVPAKKKRKIATAKVTLVR